MGIHLLLYKEREVKKGTFVYLKFRDMTTDDSWALTSEAPKFVPVQCEAIGKVVAVDKKSITIIGMWCDEIKKDGMICAIPRGCIESITELKEIT